MFVGSGAHNPHGLSSLESRHFPPRISLCQLYSLCHCSSLQRDVDFFFFFFGAAADKGEGMEGDEREGGRGKKTKTARGRKTARE